MTRLLYKMISGDFKFFSMSLAIKGIALTPSQKLKKPKVLSSCLILELNLDQFEFATLQS